MTTIENDCAIPDIADEVQQGQLSSPVKRLFASFIDSILSGLIAIAIDWYLAGSFEAMIAAQKTVSPVQNVVENLLGFSLFLILHGYLLAREGQTIGKRIYGIRIVRTNRSKAGFGRIIMLRELPLFLVAAIPFTYVSTILILIDSLLIFRHSRQCLHDQIADTIVINA